MKLLSLFSGIGAFEKALDRLEIDYKLINYCEIDKYTSKSYAAIHNVSEKLNLGDITKINTSKLPNDVDLITYGFPCQDISLAGKQKGFEEDGKRTRSGLFFEALRIIEDVKPKYAIAENVKNLTSKKFKNEFSVVLNSLEQAGYNNYWEVLNARNYGIPQNRERVFIVSIRKDIDDGMFEFPKSQELKLRLKDMLEDEVDEKYYLSEKMIDYISANNKKWTGNNDKSLVNKSVASTLNTGEGTRRCDASNYIIPNVKEENIDIKPIRKYGIFDTETSKHQAGSVWETDGLAPTLDTMQGGYSKSCIEVKEKTKRGYKEAYEGDGVYLDRPHQKRGVVQSGMIQTLKTSGNDVGVAVSEPQVINPSKDKTKNGWHFEQNIYDENGITRTVKAGGGSANIPKVMKGLRIRKLTPLECFRLMGFDDSDFHKAELVNSNTQLYKQAGNSIVVNVLEAIFKQLF